MKILIIDDSQVSRMIIAKSIASLNAEIIEAGSGQEGIIKAGKESPDIIILDLLMTDIDGFGVLEKLKENKSAVPVIILSADIQNSTKDRALKLGAKGFINKPVNPETLKQLILSNTEH